jgi:drug/metabolite transporter (DMT)-like permease
MSAEIAFPTARRPPQNYPSTLLDSPPSSNALLLDESSHRPITKDERQPAPSPLPAFVISRIPPAYLSIINQNMGLLLVACSQLFFACMNISVKYFLSITDLSVLTLIATRMVITSVFSHIALLLLGNPNPFLGPPAARKLLLLRGFFGFGGLASSYQSFRGLSVSDTMTIQYLSPALTGVMGWVLLGEKMRPREIGVGFACLIGVTLVSRPPFIFGSAVASSDLPGTISDPQEAIDHARSRMIAVAWALLSVVSSVSACELVTDC